MTPETTKTADTPPSNPRIELLRHAVRFTYDLQKLRIQQGNRAGPQGDETTAALDESHKVFLAKASETLHDVEAGGFKEVKRILKGIPIYDQFLRHQKGIGPAMAGVIVSGIDIHKAPTVSALWKYCGLDVVDGHAPKPIRGQKITWNPWVRSKLLAVLGGSFLKSSSPWRQFYDNYKTRKQNQIVPVCALCLGAKVFPVTSQKMCENCAGKGGDCAWGRSDAHRHQASIRYMVKMFLGELHTQWRTLEGLPIRESYAEQYLGRPHHPNPFRPVVVAEVVEHQPDDPETLADLELEAA